MLSPQVQFLDVNPWHWCRLCDAVFAAPAEHGITLLVQAGRVVKAHDSRAGLRPELKALDAGEPAALARRLYEAEHPDWVQVLDVAALHDYGVAVQTMHDWRGGSDAYLARCYRARNHFRGGLVRYPPWPAEMPIAGVPHGALSGLVAGVPDGHALVLAAFEGDAVWTSAIARIQAGQIALITSTDAFLPEDARWPSWRATYQGFLGRVASAVGPVHLALLATRCAFLELIEAKEKGVTLRRLIAEGEALACRGMALCDLVA